MYVFIYLFIIFVKQIRDIGASSKHISPDKKYMQKSRQCQTQDMFIKLGWLKANRVARPAGEHPRERRKGHMRGDILTASSEASQQAVEVLIPERETQLQQVKKAVSKEYMGVFK